MEFASLIAEFGARYGLEGLIPDENGAVGFDVDGHQMVLRRYEGTENVVAMLDLVDAPDTDTVSVDRLLMQANLALFALDGLALSLHPEKNCYQLLGRFDVTAMDFIDFDAAIAQMLDRAEQWRTFLGNFFSVAAETHAAVPADVSARPSANDPILSMMRV